MQRLLTILAMVALAVLIAGPTFAQQQGQQGKGEAKGQVQGKGASEQAPKGQAKGQQDRNQFYPPGITQNPWFSNPAVREHLKITDEQYNKMNQAWGQSFDKFRTGVNDLGNVSADQRSKSMQDLSGTFNKSFSQATQGVLNQDQQNRYNQLQMQYGGFNFMFDPDITTQLNLTQQQQTQLQNAANQWQSNVGRIDWSDPQKGMQSYYGLLPRVRDTVRDILNDTQDAVYDRLYGEPFRWSTDVNVNTNNNNNNQQQNREE